MKNQGFRGWTLPRADPGLRSAPSGAPGGPRGGPGAHFGVPGGPVGALGSDINAPRIDSELRFLVSGALQGPEFSTKLIVAATEIILSTRRRFRIAASSIFETIQHANDLRTVDPCAFKTSQGIFVGTPLSGSAAVGAAQ